MKPNVLRTPLIYSAILLTIFSLLVYFTGTSPGGSVWASIGTLFLVAFRTIQWIIGLALGLIICLAVLFAIFFGAVAMFNPSSASRMVEGLRQTLVDWFTPVLELLKSNREEKLATAVEGMARQVKEEIGTEIRTVQSSLQRHQADLDAKLTDLSARLTALDETASGKAAAGQVDILAEEIKGAVETAAGIRADVDNLRSAVSPATLLGELPARVEALEQQEAPETPPVIDITPLEQEVTGLQEGLASLEKKVAAAMQPVETAASADGAAEEEHRLFSYFDDPKDKKKVAGLVAATLEKDMSYNQVMEILAKELGGKKGEIITSHPALTKEYIRHCRNAR